jgi:hypothetical protein
MSKNLPVVKPVKLISGLLFNETINLARIDAKLISLFGPIDMKSPAFPFNFTDYYSDEMGINLAKQFYAFEKLIVPDTLADIKNAFIKLESEYSSNGKRNVNIDPGYLEESKLVLASTKNFSHRIYLRDNIWAEITLRYVKSEFVFHPWTYADYQQPLATDFFKQVREKYRTQLNVL